MLIDPSVTGILITYLSFETHTSKGKTWYTLTVSFFNPVQVTQGVYNSLMEVTSDERE